MTSTCTLLLVIHVRYDSQGWTQRGCLWGGGHFKPKAQAVSGGESMRGGLTPRSFEGGTGDLPRNFLKIYLSENAFRAILNPIFPYSITSILSKVRHSNTLFQTIILHFLVIWGGGGGGGEGASPGFFFKIYVSENAFQAILKPIFSIFYNLNFK